MGLWSTIDPRSAIATDAAEEHPMIRGIHHVAVHVRELDQASSLASRKKSKSYTAASGICAGLRTAALRGLPTSAIEKLLRMPLEICCIGATVLYFARAADKY